MGGAEGKEEAAQGHSSFFCKGEEGRQHFFANSNTSPVFSLRRLQVKGYVPVGPGGCSPADWFVLVCFGLHAASRLNEPAPFRSLCH